MLITDRLMTDKEIRVHCAQCRAAEYLRVEKEARLSRRRRRVAVFAAILTFGFFTALGQMLDRWFDSMRWQIRPSGSTQYVKMVSES